MKRLFRGLVCLVMLCATVFGSGILTALAAEKFPAETNPFGENYYIGETDQDEIFFEDVLPKIAKNIKTNNKHSINPYYDKFTKANNSENFQGLGSTAYANINGKTVTAEAFYRVKGDALHDPNTGMGLLLYQCIQYKIKHPNEEVSMTFSDYRTSSSAAVCVLPQSKYYGYARSLFTTNYDEHGFVRISYMLAEAARMGIDVTLVTQLPSYAVKQYDPAAKKTRSRSVLKLETYFNTALETDCYEKYAPGKKVSDFMNFADVGWDVKANGADMQHMKSATVSHYLATDGSEHRYGVFLTTSNLDDINYKGENGNGKTQSGVIVSDHADIYRVTVNYTNLMVEYKGKSQLADFRAEMEKRNQEQEALISKGKESSIKKDEQILYLGTKNDPVFQMWFTPFGNEDNTWNTKYNPICKYVDKLVDSEGYIELAWTEAFYEHNSFAKTLGTKLEKAFCGNKNKNNKIAVSVSTKFDIEDIKKLKVGKDIGYCSVKSDSGIHSKDFLMTYVEDGVRHRVSILTSANLVKVGFHYRTNSMLVIDETAKTGGNFYRILGKKYSGGMISSTCSEHEYITKTTKATLTENGKIVKNCYCGKTSTTKLYSPKTFTLSTSSYVYNGKTRTPSVTVKDSKGNTLKKGTDYTATYEKGRKVPGKYTVKITFKGNYSGTKRVYFDIKPAAVKNIKASKQTQNSITLSWDKSTGATRYKVYMYNSKTKKWDSKGTTSSTSFKVYNLKTGTKYKFKVRPYTNDDGNIWSAYGDCKTFETATKGTRPTIAKVTSTAKGTATIEWSDISGESGYYLYYADKKDGKYKWFASTKANVVKATKSEFKSGKTYYFKVVGYTKAGDAKIRTTGSKPVGVKVK